MITWGPQLTEELDFAAGILLYNRNKAAGSVTHFPFSCLQHLCRAMASLQAEGPSVYALRGCVLSQYVGLWWGEAALHPTALVESG